MGNMDELLTKGDLIDISVQLANMNGCLKILENDAKQLKSHLITQNGKVKENQVAISDIKIDIATLKTEQKYNEKEHDRTSKNQDKNEKRFFDIIKENGNIILTVFVIISTILSWIK